MGSHSSFDRGIPSAPPIFTSTTLSNAFLNAVIAPLDNADSERADRSNTNTGVGHFFDRVGYDRSGPPMLTIDPNGRRTCVVSPSLVDVLDWTCLFISYFHHLIPDSAATLPPCANPNKWILFGGHEQL